jgi:hypothetical protein
LAIIQIQGLSRKREKSGGKMGRTAVLRTRPTRTFEKGNELKFGQGKFREVRLPHRAGAYSLPRIFMLHHNM